MLAAKVDCPWCDQSTGEPCLTMTAYPRPQAPHADRIKARKTCPDHFSIYDDAAIFQMRRRRGAPRAER